MPTFSALTISTLLNHLSGARSRLAASLRMFAMRPGPAL